MITPHWSRRRLFGLATLFAPLGASAQKPGPKAVLPRIGVIWLGELPTAPLPPASPIAQFRDNLRELGWVEGQNIAIESRFAGAGQDLARQVEQLIVMKVDVIVAMSTAAALATRHMTTSVPVVFSVAGDPVQFGLVATLRRPGGNLTGTYGLTSDHGGKRLALLHEAARHSTRIAVLWTPPDPLRGDELKNMQAAAGALSIQLVPLEVRTVNDFGSAFEAAKKADATGLSLLTSPLLAVNLRWLANLALANRLPAVAGWRGFAQVGGLLGYGANLAEDARRTATYVDKILKGARPADLPVEQSTRFDLVINLKTAKSLGLTIPQSLLLRADELVE